VQPGTWAYVHKGDGKKRGGTKEIGTGAWHRAVGIDRDVPIWERIPRNANNKLTRSKNFAIYALRPGISAYEMMGREPPSPLPENAPKRSTQILRGIRHIVRLSEMFADIPPNNIADIRGVSDTTGKLPTFMTMDASGRILRQDGDVLKPTGGFVHIIPEELVTPADLKRSRELLVQCLDKYPHYLIGHEAHKHFPEWNSVCRGRVTSVDEDHDHNTLW
jgi:hypothetical protein